MNCVTVSCTALMENGSWQKVWLTWYPIPPFPCKLKYKLIYWTNDYTKHTLSTVIYQVRLSENDCQFVKKYILNKKKKRYMYIQCKITLKRSNNLFYVEMQKCIQSSENEYHDKSWKIHVYRSVWFKEESKFEKGILKCTFKARSLLKWLPMCTIHFLDIYQTPLGNKTFNKSLQLY